MAFLSNFKSDNSALSSFEYGYDAAGNKIDVREASGDRVTWTYDTTSQLTNEQRSGVNAYNTTFVYDPAGNRLKKSENGALTTYIYDVANQLQTSETASGLTTAQRRSHNRRLGLRKSKGGR